MMLGETVDDRDAAGAKNLMRSVTANAVLTGTCNDTQDEVADVLEPVLAQALRRELRQLRTEVREDVRSELHFALKADVNMPRKIPLPQQPGGILHNWLERTPKSALVMEELKEDSASRRSSQAKEGKHGTRLVTPLGASKKTASPLSASKKSQSMELEPKAPGLGVRRASLDLTMQDVVPSASQLSTPPSPQGAANRRMTPEMRMASTEMDVGNSMTVPDFRNSVGEDIVSNASSEDPTKMKNRVLRLLKVIVSSSRFEVASGIITIGNAALLGWQTDYAARYVLQDMPTFLVPIEFCFAMVFTTELVLRLSVFQRQFFYMRGWRWNVMDVVFVGLQLSECIMILCLGDQDDISSLSMMRTMRILRLSRSVRVVRVLRYLDDLRTVMVAVMYSMKPLCSVLILVLFVVYAAGIYFTELMAAYRTEGHPAKEDFDQLAGSLAMTMLRLLQTITNGIEWNLFSGPLIEHIGPAMGMVFAAYIIFMTLAILNIVTGVFVEAAMCHNRHEKNLFMINNLRELFYKLGLDKNGSIAYTDFLGCCEDPHLQTFLKDIDLDISEAKGLFQVLDKTGSGSIDSDDFLSGCLHLRGPARALDMHLLMREIVFLRTTAHEQLETVQAVRCSEEKLESLRASLEREGGEGGGGGRGGDGVEGPPVSRPGGASIASMESHIERRL